jgi:hypothetical protein
MLASLAMLFVASPAFAAGPANGHSSWGTEHVNNKGPNGENVCKGGGCSQAGGTVRDDGKTNPPPGHAK